MNINVVFSSEWDGLCLCWLWTRCGLSSVCGVWTHRPISWRISRRPAYQRRAAASCRSSTWPTTTWPTGVCRSWPDTHTCGSCTWPTTTCRPSQPGNSTIQSLLWTLHLCLAQAGTSWQTYSTQSISFSHLWKLSLPLCKHVKTLVCFHQLYFTTSK